MENIGILAYGSIKTDPGTEIVPLIERRMPTRTPFPVEFGRYSKTRGLAPTVVPHPQGQPVEAEVLVLASSVTLLEAKNLLYRREIQQVGSDKIYREGDRPPTLQIADQPGLEGLDHVLYVDFREDNKIPAPDASELARAAVESVNRAPQDWDGITYLIKWLEAGIATPLTPKYQKEILALTGTATLAEALETARQEGKGNR